MSGLRFGLLGYGAIAAEHAKALGRLDCELVAVAGPTLESAEAFASEHGVARAGTDVAAVIAAGDLDAILVASPNAVHVDQALAALEAGKHVLCEVPLAMSSADAARVAGARGTLMVCHTQRFWRPAGRRDTCSCGPCRTWSATASYSGRNGWRLSRAEAGTEWRSDTLSGGSQ